MNFFRLVAALAVSLGLRAAVPPPSQLFPQDSLLMLTVPDWNRARSSMSAAPLGRLWADPAMKPFRDRFNQGFRERFLASLEKDLGMKPEDYLPLLQGQVTFGVVKGAWNPSDEKTDPTLVLVVDVQNQSETLRAKLAEARTRLSGSKQEVRVQRIRDIEFTTLVMKGSAALDPTPQAGKDPEDADESEAEGTASGPMEMTFGQVDTALVVATALPGLDRIVARLTGGAVPTLAETPEYQGAEAACGFRESMAYGFIQAAALVEALQSSGEAENSAGGGFGVPPEKIVSVSGLDGLQSLAVSARQSESGLLVRFFAALPESKRNGLFKLLRFEAKDTSPPAFVPADASEFRRIRLNGQQLWTGVEGLIQQLSPQVSAILAMSMNALGKEGDPGFDFRKMFIGNLGDDVVSYGKPPQGTTLAELKRSSSITLVGAVNANEMLAAVRAVAGLIPGEGKNVQEREVNGKKILSLKMPAEPGSSPRTMEVAASGGYVAFSSDAVVLEEFLRSADGSGRSLKDLPGLAEAAQQVGGMTTGTFGFQNQRKSSAGLWEGLKSGGSLDNLVPSMGVKPVQEAGSWLDFSVLPPFDRISQYFGISVSSGAWDSQGFMVRVYTPIPQ